VTVACDALARPARRDAPVRRAGPRGDQRHPTTSTPDERQALADRALGDELADRLPGDRGAPRQAGRQPDEDAARHREGDRDRDRPARRRHEPDHDERRDDQPGDEAQPEDPVGAHDLHRPVDERRRRQLEPPDRAAGDDEQRAAGRQPPEVAHGEL
jgi:hypothetical protein